MKRMRNMKLTDSAPRCSHPKFKAMACFHNGGTGVTPVKSGVAPDFVGRRCLRMDVRQGVNWGRPAGSGRHARNNRLAAVPPVIF
jgi:hypothetical protein